MFEILPSGPLRGSVNVPGSKYQANRALLLAALAQGHSSISNIPENDDISRVKNGLSQLGVTIACNDSSCRIDGVGANTNWRSGAVQAGASGTFARLALALAALGHQPITIDGSARLRERPMHDLAEALRDLGAVVTGPANDALPLTVTGPLLGGHCKLPGHISSQFISALLIAAPFAKNDVHITLTSPLVSRQYVEMTLQMMRDMGVVATMKTDASGETSFHVDSAQRYEAINRHLEADPCSASYFMAAAALTGGDIEIPSFNFDSVQGEAGLPAVLEQMGCLIKRSNNGIRIMGPGLGLRAVDVDMGNMPDVVQTVAVLAAYAHGVTRLYNIAHLIHKESNRIFDTALELKKIGVEVEASADALIIVGGTPQGTVIDTHDDHRMAMSFAIAGLKTPGLRIAHPEVAAKSFPGFWDCLRSLGVTVREC